MAISRVFYLSVIFCFSVATSMAQFSFKGRVVANDNTALQGVSIEVNKAAVTTSSASGTFMFNAESDSVKIRFSYAGFKTFSGVFVAPDSVLVVLSRMADLLPEAIVTSYESNTVLKNIPATVSVLAKADLERYSNTNLIAAVNTVPGVKMDERSPGSYRLSIRGNLLRSPFGVRNVKVYWNGIPFTDANGNTYINQIGFNNVDKIEVLKGPGGSMYGAGTGGVLLLGNGVNSTKENSIQLNTLGGSYGSFGSDITYKQASANSNSSLSFGHQQSDGWRQQTSMRRDVANYTASFNISDKQTIHANIFYSDLYYQTPGGLTKRQMDSAAQQSRPAAGAFKSAAAQQAALFVKTIYAGFANEYKFNQRWSNTTSVYTSSTRFKNPSILNYQRKTEQGIGGRSVTQFKQQNITISFGGEYQYGFTSTRTFGNQFGVPDTLQFDDEIAATQYNLFAQAEVRLPADISITGGFSYNNYGYGFTRLNKRPVVTTNKNFSPVLVPRIAVIKKFGNNVGLYATVSQGYSPPTIDEIVPSTGVFNVSLNAEKATSYEVGFRAEIPNKIYFSAAYYLLRLTNTIVTRRDASGADYFVNTGNTNQRGLELSVNYFPVKNSEGFVSEIKLWANYTNLIANFKTYKQGSNDYSGNRLTGTPPNVVVAGADVVTKIGLYANVTYSYTDQLPLNDANTFFASQYNLLFLKAGYKVQLSKKLRSEIFAAFDHSFNQPYSLGNDLNAAGNRYYNPSAPQNFTGGLKLSFNFQ